MLKNKFKKLAYFYARKIGQQTDHIYHAIDHNSPQKHHRLRTTFPKTTLKKARKIALFAPQPRPEFFLKNLCRILRKIPHPEHMEILQPSLQHINKPVVSIGIGRPKKKARLQHEILGIADDSFDHLAIVEVHPHPQPRHGRRMFMKMKRSMAKVSIEGLNEENRLGVPRRHIFDSPCIQQLQSNRIKRIHGVIAQQLLD
jgi:hypothetical protein